MEHWGDASATSNHANFTRQRGGIVELTSGTFNANLVTNFEEGNIAGDIALLVGLGIMRECSNRKVKQKIP